MPRVKSESSTEMLGLGSVAVYLSVGQVIIPFHELEAACWFWFLFFLMLLVMKLVEFWGYFFCSAFVQRRFLWGFLGFLWVFYFGRF